MDRHVKKQSPTKRCCLSARCTNPALLTVGYVVARRPIPDPAKWAIIALLSFAITLSLYGFLIRPVNLLRFLFGMKPRGDGPTA